jgi:hypothetical protein
MDVAYNLVHPHETGNIATFRCLLLDMVGPMFLNALNQSPPKKKKHPQPCTQTQKEDKIGGVDTRAKRTHLVNA